MLNLMESVYPFPEMSGSEEEFRLTISELNNRNSKNDLPKLLSGMDSICPPLPGSKDFRANGSRTYIDAKGIELATPEVKTPIDQLVYTEAGVRILSDSLTNFLLSESKRTKTEQYGIVQRRVIDNDGNTWGVHDNFSVWDPDYLSSINQERTTLGQVWSGFLSSRGFITGAMRVDETPTFSQKLSVEHAYSTKSYSNSLLYADTSNGPRLEIRCSDVNLQEWAFVSRIGGAALVLAATQTRLIGELSKNYQTLMSQNISAWNTIPLDKDLGLKADTALLSAIDIQHFTMSTILDRLEDYMNLPIPKVYRRIGEEILKFCEDVEAVAFGSKDLTTLMGRADWAGKLVVLREHLRRNPSGRRIGDAKSKLLDLWYDQIFIDIQSDGSPSTTYGYGYDQASASYSQSHALAIEHAIKNPPTNTRAAQRVKNAQKLGDRVKDCDWHNLVYDDQGKLIEMYFDI